MKNPKPLPKETPPDNFKEGKMFWYPDWNTYGDDNAVFAEISASK
jgi:hypothetical protein